MKKSVTFLIPFILFYLFQGTSLFAQHKPDDIVGAWLNEEGTAKVLIFKEKTSYYGKIIWLKTPNDSVTGKPRTDKLNPDPKYHNVPLVGLVNLRGFVFDGKDEWSDGSIYDPKNGKTYKCYIKFESAEKLKIRGYIGVSLLGRTTYWTKSTQ
jgi:uncharacterized protein (DUF2147 family)